MWNEFKTFISRSSVLALAVAVVMGAAFGAVVSSFTNDILLQVIAALGAKPDFSQLSVSLNGTPIRYGNFLTAVLSFILVALAMFLVVQAANRVQRREPAAKQDSEVDLLRQIRDVLQERPPLHS